MNRIEKNKAKKLAKILIISAYVCILVFVMLFILIVSGILKKSINSNTLLIINFFFLILAFVLTIFGLKYNTQVESYKTRLEYMKQKLYAHMIVDLINAGDIQGAIDIYRNCLKDYQYRLLLQGYLIAEFGHSDDIKWRNKSKEQLEKIFK